MNEEVKGVFSAYRQAEEEMRKLLDFSDLTPEQIVVLGQLSPAIVEGRTKPNSADRVIGNIIKRCNALGIPGELIDSFRVFGEEWVNILYPQS